MPIGEDINVECYDKDGENLISSGNRVLAFQIASREEIYQKYSVVVAIFFSIIAMVISMINAIGSIIQFVLGIN